MRRILIVLLCAVVLVCAASLFSGCDNGDDRYVPTVPTVPPTTESNTTTTFIDETTITTVNSDETTNVTEENGKPNDEVFDTENIARITFYAYYGQGEGSDVPTENMAEITEWLGSFTVGEKTSDLLAPGTNTYYVEIEYLNGTVIKKGLDVIKIDENSYYLESDEEPDCFMEIISRTNI